MAKKTKDNKTKRGNRAPDSSYLRIKVRLAFRILELWSLLGHPTDLNYIALAAFGFLLGLGKAE